MLTAEIFDTLTKEQGFSVGGTTKNKYDKGKG